MSIIAFFDRLKPAQARPGGVKFGDGTSLGQIKNMAEEAIPVDRDKIIRFVNRCMDKAKDTQLRVIALVAYHITK